jgi:replicative DNA helicase
MSLYVEDMNGITFNEIYEQAAAMVSELGIGLIVIDYIGLVEGEQGKSRQEEIAKISRGIKKLVRDLKVPAIIVAQLNRDCESRVDKRPMMNDLRDSGQIEMDAASILMVYRDDYYNPNSQDRGFAEILVRKNRYGATGTVRLGWNGPKMQFFSIPEAPCPFGAYGHPFTPPRKSISDVF